MQIQWLRAYFYGEKLAGLSQRMRMALLRQILVSFVFACVCFSASDLVAMDVELCSKGLVRISNESKIKRKYRRAISSLTIKLEEGHRGEDLLLNLDPKTRKRSIKALRELYESSKSWEARAEVIEMIQFLKLDAALKTQVSQYKRWRALSVKRVSQALYRQVQRAAPGPQVEVIKLKWKMDEDSSETQLSSREREHILNFSRAALNRVKNQEVPLDVVKEGISDFFRVPVDQLDFVTTEQVDLPKPMSRKRRLARGLLILALFSGGVDFLDEREYFEWWKRPMARVLVDSISEEWLEQNPHFQESYQFYRDYAYREGSFAISK